MIQPRPHAVPPAYPPSIREAFKAARRVTGAGSYTDIHTMSVPTEAAAGQVVSVSCYIKNLATFAIYIACTCSVNGQAVPMSPEYASVAAASSQRYSGSFTMPSSKATLKFYAWYWTGTQWYLDDEETLTINVVAKAEFRNLVIQSYTQRVYAGVYCDVACRFEHKGPAVSKQLYAAIGNKGIIFDEILHGSIDITAAQHSAWAFVYGTAKIYITKAISPGLYDLYAKLDGAVPDLITGALLDVIRVDSSEAVFSGLTATYQVIG